MRTFKLGIALAAIALLGAACTPGTVTTNPDGGVWVTETGGESWEQRSTVYEDRLAKKTMGEVNVLRIVFSPADSRKMFAVTQKSGLWFSWNQGY
ncbi:MAG: hypothetical protein Q8P78_01675, partial [bacterium]|nr:hypothetical protein [bacterium]